jgi:hypothetical protein
MTTVLQPDEFNQVITGDIYLNTNTVEIDVDGNIVSDTLTASTQLTRSGIGILNTLLNNVDFTGIVFNATGFAYQSLTSLATVTWENLSTKIQAISALTQATNATTLNVNNAVRIQNGETEPTAPLQYIQLLADASDGHNKLSLSGSIGTANQVLASGGANGSLAWVTQSGGVATFGTLAQTLNEGAIADRDIDMDNNDLLNVRTIENLDSSGYEGVMNAQQNYTQKVTPASTQGWGFKTNTTGAYCYVQDDLNNLVQMTIDRTSVVVPPSPNLQIKDIFANRKMVITAEQISFGTANEPFPDAPPANAFLGTDATGILQYSQSVPTTSTLETVLGNSTPEGDAGGKPINDVGTITFSKATPLNPSPALSIGCSAGEFPECLTINSEIINNASKRETGTYLPILVNGEQYFIPLYGNLS